MSSSSTRYTTGAVSTVSNPTKMNRIRHEAMAPSIWPRPNDTAAANMVANPLVPYQQATRIGCSARLYHCAVITENSGRHAASNRPSRNLVASRPAYESQAAMHACAVPQPNTSAVMSSRCGTRTISHDASGRHTSCAMDDMELTVEYSSPESRQSVRRPQTAPYPSTDLSRICRK